MPVEAMTKLEFQLLLVHYIACIFSLFLCLWGLYIDIPLQYCLAKVRQNHE